MGFRIGQTFSLRFARLIAERQAQTERSLTSLATGSSLTSFRQDAATNSRLIKLDAQLKGLSQAALNVSSAQSVVDKAQTYVTDLTEIANSLAELTKEAEDSGITSERRTAIATEVKDLIGMFSTKLREASLLEEPLFQANRKFSVQVGSLSAQSYSFGIGEIRASTLGRFTRVASTPGQVNTPIALSGGQDVQINGVSLTASSADTVSSSGAIYSAIAQADSVNAVSAKTGVTATLEANSRLVTISQGIFSSVPTGINLGGQNFRLNGVSITGNIQSTQDFVDAVNAQTASTGLRAEIESGSVDGLVRIIADDGRNINVQMDIYSGEAEADQTYRLFNPDAADLGQGAEDYAISLGDEGLFKGRVLLSRLQTHVTNFTQIGYFTLESDSEFVVTGGSKSGAVFGIAKGTYSPLASTSLSNISVDTADEAVDASRSIRLTLDSLKSSESQLNAIEKRLEFSAASIARQEEAIEATKERLTKIDIPQVLATITANQLTTDAALAAFTQANLNAQETSKALFSSLLFRRF